MKLLERTANMDHSKDLRIQHFSQKKFYSFRPQIEDDVLSKPNFVTSMLDFALSRSALSQSGRAEELNL